MIRQWEAIVEDLNNTNACGLCFTFIGAGRKDYFNNLTPREGSECCVHIGLLKFGSKSIFKESQIGRIKIAEDHTFEVVAAFPSRMDIQFYNEDPEQEKIDTSKYAQYIEPLIECLGNNFNLPCIDGLEEFEITEWQWDLLLNYQDFNLDGIYIRGAFRKNVV